jgi:hypothetical protein
VGCPGHLSDKDEGNDKQIWKTILTRNSSVTRSGDGKSGTDDWSIEPRAGGLDPGSLNRWSKLHSGRDKTGTGGSLSALELENAKLRRELETVGRQRDILKQALGILSEGANNFTK